MSPAQVANPASLPVVHTGPTPPALLSSPPNAVGLLTALRRRWFVAVGVGLVCAVGVCAALWFLLPAPKATARALLKLESDQPRVIFLTREQRASFEMYQKTQAVLLKSRMVLNRAMRNPKVRQLKTLGEQADPLEWLEKEIKVDYSVGPEFLRVSLSGNEPQDLEILVNEIIDSYLQDVVSDESRGRRRHLEQLQELAAKYDDIMRDKRQTLRNLAKGIGSGEAKTLAVKHRIALEQQALVQKEILQLDSDLRKLQAEAEIYKAKEKQATDLTIPENIVEEQLKKDPIIAKNLAKITELEEAVTRARKYYEADEAERILKTNKTIETLAGARAAVAARRKEIHPHVVKELRDNAGKAFLAKGLGLQDQMGLSAKLRAMLVAEAERLEKQSVKIGDTSMEVEDVRNEIERTEPIAKTLNAEVEALKVELAAPPRVRWFEKAVIQRHAAKKFLLPVGAGAGTFLLILLGISWLEFRSRRVNTVDEVVQGLGLRLMGALPPMPDHANPVGRSSTRYTSWQRQLTESIDTARTVLLHSAHVETMRVVMVTSALSGEGKTSVSGHLAISLARAGYRTLLIDGDLRNPSAHRIFDLPVQPGFAELLRDEILPAEATRVTPIPGLWMIPAGLWDSQIVTALAQGKAGTIFNQVKQWYDFVVVDSAPVLPVADSLMIGKHADAVIFSVLREVSRIPTVHAAQQRLAMLGVNILGAVVSAAQGDIYGSDYHYGRTLAN
jgi:capsular exopolysaccharide synthesis family protein